MQINKTEILSRICYTDMVYDRINKKLKANYSRREVELFICSMLSDTTVEQYKIAGKNIYVASVKDAVRITINSHTFRIITVDRLDSLLKKT